MKVEPAWVHGFVSSGRARVTPWAPVRRDKQDGAHRVTHPTTIWHAVATRHSTLGSVRCSLPRAEVAHFLKILAASVDLDGDHLFRLERQQVRRA